MRLALLALLLVAAPCSPAPAKPANAFVLEGAPFRVEVREGRVAAVGPAASHQLASLPTGGWISPAFVDSHVHLAYLPVAKQEEEAGIAAVVDLASPEAFLEHSLAPLKARYSGPMITAPGGYPTQSWGKDGYGLQCATAEQARAAVRRLHAKGATIAKIPFEDPQLSPEAIAAVVEEAHLLGMKVVAHALSDAGAAAAAKAGIDVLAHTPIERLSDATVEAWKGRAVISTLAAFGASEFAVGNLRRLRAAGVTVLYGTDLGNDTTPGIDPEELSALIRAGLDGEAILKAGTSDPATYWGFADLGAIEPGRAASFIITRSDPREEPLVLATPLVVYLDGVRLP